MSLEPPGPLTGRGASRVAAAVVLLGVLLVTLAASARAQPVVELDYYGTEGCPYCARMQVVLEDLEERHGDALTIARYEVAEPAARDRWVSELAARGLEAQGVPTVILGERVWVGYDQRIAEELELAVATAVGEAADARTSRPTQASGPPAPGTEPGGGDATVLDVPLVGEVEVADRSAIAATALIAFVDGFNPCSLWVLTILLAMVLQAGASRARVAVVGGTFLAVTGLIYGAFIAGVFTVLGFVEHLGAIRVGVAVVALVVGLVNIKDYLAFGRGFSFSIPDRVKPRIYRGGRAVRRLDRPLPAVLATTVGLAAGIALVELPCTAGFPVIWSGLLRTQGIEGGAFVGLLALYLLIYVLDEVVLFAVVLATMRIGRFQERHGRLLKLLAGTVMLALGIVLLVLPSAMDDLLTATLVVGGAVVAAVVIDRALVRREPPQGPTGTARPDREAARR